MTTLIQFSINLSALYTIQSNFGKNRTSCYSLTRPKIGSFQGNSCKLRAFGDQRQKLCFFERGKDGILVKEEGLKNKKKRVVLVRFNEDFGFNGGGGGGGNNSNNARILGNLALAIGLTYFSMTGQLGWVLDAIVSIWCPNCGNDFQIFKSTLNDELQLCPYCSQPFSVVDDKFVRESVRFSNESTTFGQAFSDFFPGSRKGRESSTSVVDVEAEIKDAD
ncbi:hypothetical protein KPL70_026542 [Citrus sinensis]|nr:hypothetical protein KPL70_026542 [Citrus sinensis]